MRPKEREATVALLDSLEHYDITRPVAERAGLLRREWSARGKTIALPDLLIASVALTHGLILVTDNAGDFPMKDLQLHSFGSGTFDRELLVIRHAWIPNQEGRDSNNTGCTRLTPGYGVTPLDQERQRDPRQQALTASYYGGLPRGCERAIMAL